MTIVTDKQFYINHNMKDLLDLCAKREKAKWDNCIIIDGKERAGKSTLAKILAYYYASITNKKFDVTNIYFDPNKLGDDAKKTRNKIFIWDEAAIGGEAISWQNKEIQKLNRVLQTCGKYQHFYIFIIPQFHRLHKYLAIDRSIALIHVYSPDMLKRGDYLCLNEQQKTWVYNRNKISESYGTTWSFNGSWAMKNTEDLIDEKEYERKKDEAISKLDQVKDDKATMSKQWSKMFKYFCAKHVAKDVMIERFDITPGTLNRWRKIDINKLENPIRPNDG